MNSVADKEIVRAESAAVAVRRTSVQKHPCASQLFLPDTIFNKPVIRVAMVDDQDPVLEAFTLLLNRETRVQTVGAFASAQQALEKLPEILPDVVLMDVRMCGMNGIECTKQLKQLIPAAKVIIVTALGSEDAITEAIKAGADYFLSKPVSRSGLD